ncbi:homoserine kinase [Streptococcus entericus]|uniref:homoserine kinase n=1 Tax=Streptococcus entericus TaxID=155680 RepID=UPI0003677C16|nr:homoserine kinase [Streptococcus entericus]
MKIIVPATSANIGPGFDSVGVAVSKYLTVEVLEGTEDWIIEHDLGEEIPADKTNLLITTALEVSENLLPHRLKMSSDIPLARGLGSSSSVIVAGIELANQLGNLQLSDEDKLRIANSIEGHPDNVAPAIFGNLVVASYVDGELSHLVAPFPVCSLLAYIPSYELKTSESRGVLPETLSYKEAVAASAVSNMAITGLLTGDMVLAGKAIQNDHFHEPYRQRLVREFASVKSIALTAGAYGVYLSGAGPTIMILAPRDKVELISQAVNRLGHDGELVQLIVDTQGLRVEK